MVACIELAATYPCNFSLKNLHKGEVGLVINKKVVPSGETRMTAHWQCTTVPSLVLPPKNRNGYKWIEMVRAVLHPLDS